MSREQWGHGYYTGLNDGYHQGINDGYSQGTIDGFNYGYDSASKNSSGDFAAGAAIATVVVGGIAALISAFSNDK